MPDTPLSTPAFLMLHNAGRHDIGCRWSRIGLVPKSEPCSCGLLDDIREIEAAHIDALTAANERLRNAAVWVVKAEAEDEGGEWEASHRELRLAVLGEPDDS